MATHSFRGERDGEAHCERVRDLESSRCGSEAASAEKIVAETLFEIESQ
jgi:hypothetical protein